MLLATGVMDAHAASLVHLQVKFFARVCGLYEPVPTESFNFYLQAISILMMDILGAGSMGEREWVAAHDGSTWVPARMAVTACKRYGVGSNRASCAVRACGTREQCAALLCSQASEARVL